jgi:hypothetical protein
MRNPDKTFSQFTENLDLDTMHRRARAELDRQAIKPEDFPLYSREMIGSDKEEVVALEKQILEEEQPDEREARKMADVLEAVVLELGELGNWFSDKDNVTTIKTSRYDDLKNGTDIILEFDEAEQGLRTLGLGIDVTYSENLTKKIQGLRRKVETGKLSTIRYFYSEKSEFRGEQLGVPGVITGVSNKHAMELASMWIEKKREKLSDHPAQIILLEEIEAQLVAFCELVKQSGNPNAERSLTHSLAIIRNSLNGKREFIRKHTDEIEKYRQEDKVYAAIMEQVLHLNEKKGH